MQVRALEQQDVGSPLIFRSSGVLPVCACLPVNAPYQHVKQLVVVYFITPMMGKFGFIRRK
jgi:hypothetical protein